MRSGEQLAGSFGARHTGTDGARQSVIRVRKITGGKGGDRNLPTGADA